MFFWQKPGPVVFITRIGDLHLCGLLITSSSLLRGLRTSLSHDCTNSLQVIQNNPREQNEKQAEENGSN